MCKEWFRKKCPRLELGRKQNSFVPLCLGILVKNRVGDRRKWDAGLRIYL